ncbi:carbohydrate-binding module family 13 protein [Phlebiopsis gigantea 11061_1 CR5-6]|uniref:Carbohydrate-binding module family 13 protein n=1 Tax=Phlebiopsis gigantea (strain 11061_1 CR5-6) TaxID=745531 RepID=A0A0C3RPG7_PHLG1|nr:carbohydrate-binding module family 13 protein [Phlebiopsis gigantea 11061_1 CR5-6]
MATIESGGAYVLFNAKAGNCVDLSGTDGESVIGWDYHGGDNQKWRFEQRGGPGWTIQNVGTGRYLSITQGAGDNVRVLGTSDPTEWEVRRDEDDPACYRFFILNTPFNLDLTNNGDATPGNPLTIWGQWNGRNQCWRVERA